MIEEAPMSRVINYVHRLAIFAAGIMAGVLTSSRRERGGLGPAAEQDLKRSIADLESRLEAHESADNTRFAQVETRLDEHAVKLADIPSTAQLVAAASMSVSCMPRFQTWRAERDSGIVIVQSSTIRRRHARLTAPSAGGGSTVTRHCRQLALPPQG